MRERIKLFLYGGDHFRKEFRKQARLLIVFTLGFTVAFTWRQTVFDVFASFIELITHTTNKSALSILTSLAITIVSLLVVYLTSFFLQDKH